MDANRVVFLRAVYGLDAPKCLFSSSSFVFHPHWRKKTHGRQVPSCEKERKGRIEFCALHAEQKRIGPSLPLQLSVTSSATSRNTCFRAGRRVLGHTLAPKSEAWKCLIQLSAGGHLRRLRNTICEQRIQIHVSKPMRTDFFCWFKAGVCRIVPFELELARQPERDHFMIHGKCLTRDCAFVSIYKQKMYNADTFFFFQQKQKRTKL